MKHASSASAALLIAALGLAAATSVVAAAPAITVGGVSPRGITLGNIAQAQRRNNAVLNHVQNNIRASQRARYRSQ